MFAEAKGGAVVLGKVQMRGDAALRIKISRVLLEDGHLASREAELGVLLEHLLGGQHGVGKAVLCDGLEDALNQCGIGCADHHASSLSEQWGGWGWCRRERIEIRFQFAP